MLSFINKQNDNSSYEKEQRNSMYTKFYSKYGRILFLFFNKPQWVFDPDPTAVNGNIYFDFSRNLIWPVCAKPQDCGEQCRQWGWEEYSSSVQCSAAGGACLPPDILARCALMLHESDCCETATWEGSSTGVKCFSSLLPSWRKAALAEPEELKVHKNGCWNEE